MNNKHLWYIIPSLLIVGFLIGQAYKFPTQFNVTFVIENKTQDLMDRYYNFTEIKFKNQCCYPLDCPQSKDNPDVCICEYMVYCYPDMPSDKPVLIR